MWYIPYESEALVEEENPERVKCSDDETLQTWDWTWNASLKGSPEASGYHKDKNLHMLNKKVKCCFIPRRMNQKPWWAWSNRQLISNPPAELIIRGFAVQSQMNFLSSGWVTAAPIQQTGSLPVCPPVGWWKAEATLTLVSLDPARSLSLDDTLWWCDDSENIKGGRKWACHTVKSMHFCVGLMLMQHVTAQNVVHSTFKF